VGRDASCVGLWLLLAAVELSMLGIVAELSEASNGAEADVVVAKGLPFKDDEET